MAKKKNVTPVEEVKEEIKEVEVNEEVEEIEIDEKDQLDSLKKKICEFY